MNRGRPKTWLAQEEKYVRDNYDKMTDREMGDKLNKTEIAVKRKRQRLGLFMRHELKILSKETVNE